MVFIVHRDYSSFAIIAYIYSVDNDIDNLFFCS